MISSLAIALAFAAPAAPGIFHHGVWNGACYRRGYLGGMDHELCRMNVWREHGPGRAQAIDIERTADGLSVKLSLFCESDLPDTHIPSSALSGTDRSRRVITMIRQQIATARRQCPSVVELPEIETSDIAAFLEVSDNLSPDNFVQLDPAVRAPAAQRCGGELFSQWQHARGLTLQPQAEFRIMMYTMSAQGPDRAERRFRAMPPLGERYMGMGTGPGGILLTTEAPLAPWVGAPLERFVALCDIAIEAWSSFVEVGVANDPSTGRVSFNARASTGVDAVGGYIVTQRPLM